MTILEHEMFMTDDLRRVPRQELEDRINRFRILMTEKDEDWQLAVISDKINMYYFTGTMQEGALIIRPQDAILWVRRSLERARNESLLPPSQIRPMRSYRQAGAYYDDVEYPAIYVAKKHTTLDWLDFFGKYFSCEEYRDLDDVLSALRSVKSPYELELMAYSGRLHEEALIRQAPKLLREGISEAELDVQLYLHMVLQGGQGIARTSRPTGEDVIGLVSFGKSALVRTAFDGPGGTGGTCVAVQSIGSAFRFLKPGRLVYLDVPCGFDGYNTDKTVVYYYGDLDKDPEKETILRAYNYCVELEKKTASLMKPGAVLGEVYDTIMKDFDPQYEAMFMNGGRFLGHSIGLYMDETPVIAGRVSDTVKENMVFAIEPKIALPGLGMVGTENTYKITKAGAVSLTGEPQGLRVINTAKSEE